MIFEELAAAGVPSTGENAPPSANDTVAEAIRDSGSHEDGEIMSENKSGGDEDLSNVEVNLDELISSKGSYPLALVFGRSKVNTELIKEYEEAGYFVLVTVVHLLKKGPFSRGRRDCCLQGFLHLWSQISMRYSSS
jgi:hypothetical protein